MANTPNKPPSKLATVGKWLAENVFGQTSAECIKVTRGVIRQIPPAPATHTPPQSPAHKAAHQPRPQAVAPRRRQQQTSRTAPDERRESSEWNAYEYFADEILRNPITGKIVQMMNLFNRYLQYTKGRADHPLFQLSGLDAEEIKEACVAVMGSFNANIKTFADLNPYLERTRPKVDTEGNITDGASLRQIFFEHILKLRDSTQQGTIDEKIEHMIDVARTHFGSLNAFTHREEYDAIITEIENRSAERQGARIGRDEIWEIVNDKLHLPPGASSAPAVHFDVTRYVPPSETRTTAADLARRPVAARPVSSPTRAPAAPAATAEPPATPDEPPPDEEEEPSSPPPDRFAGATQRELMTSHDGESEENPCIIEAGTKLDVKKAVNVHFYIQDGGLLRIHDAQFCTIAMETPDQNDLVIIKSDPKTTIQTSVPRPTKPTRN